MTVVQAIAVFSAAITATACGSSSAGSSAVSPAAPTVASSPASTSAPTTVPHASSVPSPTTAGQLKALLLTAHQLPDGITFLTGATADSSPSRNSGAPPLGSPASCEGLLQGTLYLPYYEVPIADANDELQRPVSAAVDPTELGWQGGEYLYLYRPGQASQIMTDIVRTASRCAAKPISVESAGTTVMFRENFSELPGMGDEALEVHMDSPVFHSPASLSGLYTASDWVVIRSGNVLLMTWESGNISTLNKYLTATTSAAWHAYEKGTGA
jgi:hypothetical protein